MLFSTYTSHHSLLDLFLGNNKLKIVTWWAFLVHLSSGPDTHPICGYLKAPTHVHSVPCHRCPWAPAPVQWFIWHAENWWPAFPSLVTCNSPLGSKPHGCWLCDCNQSAFPLYVSLWPGRMERQNAGRMSAQGLPHQIHTREGLLP
jgi:hypothetical protein